LWEATLIVFLVTWFCLFVLFLLYFFRISVYHSSFNENQQAPLNDPLDVPVGPIIRVRSKKIKEALNGLIQEILGDSKTGYSKLSLKKNEGIINLIQAFDGRNLLSNDVD
jgi:hypothetical protein